MLKCRVARAGLQSHSPCALLLDEYLREHSWIPYIYSVAPGAIYAIDQLGLTLVLRDMETAAPRTDRRSDAAAASLCVCHEQTAALLLLHTQVNMHGRQSYTDLRHPAMGNALAD